MWRGMTCRSARITATDKDLERGERPSGRIGREWRIGIESFKALKSNREELLESTVILSVNSLKAPTSCTTIFPPGCSNVIIDDETFSCRRVILLFAEIDGNLTNIMLLGLEDKGIELGQLRRSSIVPDCGGDLSSAVRRQN